MRKKGIALLAALLLALLAGCGANGAAQPEQIDEPAVDPNLSRKPGADVEGAE